MMHGDQNVFALIEYLVRSPNHINQIHRHQRHSTTWEVPAHEHDDLLQFDFSHGFKGEVIFGTRKEDISGTCAMFFPPKTRHGIRLEPDLSPSAIYSIKIHASSEIATLMKETFSSIQKNLMGRQTLISALERLYRLTFVTDEKTAMLVSVLCEVLSLWPRRADKMPYSIIPKEQIQSHNLEIDEQIERAIAMIESNLRMPPLLSEMAEAVGVSQRHLVRRFRAVFNTSPHIYITKRRVTRAQELLTEDRMSITELAEALGFPSIHSFSRWFHHEVGVSPSQYRQNPGIM